MTSFEPHLNVEALRNMIAGDNIDYNAAERIAIAINAAAGVPDISHLATKEDLKDLKIELYQKMSDLHISTIKWFVSIMIAQTTVMIGLVGKITGKW